MVIASSRMGHLWDALCRAHDVDGGGGVARVLDMSSSNPTGAATCF